MVASGVSPPSSGRSSLAQEIGLMPIFTSNAFMSAFLLLFALFISLACSRHFFAFGDFRDCDFPPPSAFLGRAIRIGLDTHHECALACARTFERGFQAGDVVDFLGQRPERN